MALDKTSLFLTLLITYKALYTHTQHTLSLARARSLSLSLSLDRCSSQDDEDSTRDLWYFLEGKKIEK